MADIFGTAQNDVLSATSATGDNVYGGEGNDLLIGGNGNDFLSGGAGDDAIRDYGGGSDTLAGGTGNDLYCIVSAGDLVVENDGEGIDTVETQIDYVLGANVENLTLNYGANGTGNELNNVIKDGTGANNAIFAMGGDDTVFAGAGDDFIDGGDGNDLIFGGSGNDYIRDYGNGSDTLAGGTGDDHYCVISAGDLVVENAGEGIDTVETQIDYVLGANVENLILNYGANGIGNDLNNVISDGTGAANLMSGLGGDDTIYGGAGNDTIYGGDGNDLVDGGADNDFILGDAGNDTLSGGDGVDTLFGGEGNDLINGGKGNDLLSGESGNDVLNGDDGDDTIYGGAGNDIITGGNGNDTLVTGQGNDVLTGGAGKDVFSFEAPYGQPGYNAAVVGTATITDFTSGSDTIGLSTCLFGGFGYYGTIQSTDFAIVKNETEYNAAACGSAKIIYNSANGNVFFNENGAEAGLGKGSQFATIQGAPALTTSDFQVQW
jgi:Ca2+-binding RTX toxin-like protein